MEVKVMSKLRLALSCGYNDLNRGLIDGSVTPEGIDLTVLPLPAPERHRRMTDNLEFDVSEFSLGSYLSARDKGALPVWAIPAFPLRKMRHGSIFINTRKGISGPQDLHGRRVGLLSYQVTAGIWGRVILHDHYGVDLKSIIWVVGDRDEVSFEPPAGYKIDRLPEGADLDELLAGGMIDACITPALLPSIIRNDPRVGRLWPDTKQEEMAYWRKTRVIPIMHTVVIKESLLQQHPWVAMSMLNAFRESKRSCLHRYEHDSLMLVGLCWSHELWEEQVALMGPDPFAYDFAGARHEVDAACRYSFELGLTQNRLTPEELFYPSVIQPLPKQSGGSVM
jgi:4,5-dihydroxyphthalate decarboxylase